MPGTRTGKNSDEDLQNFQLITDSTHHLFPFVLIFNLLNCKVALEKREKIQTHNLLFFSLISVFLDQSRRAFYLPLFFNPPKIKSKARCTYIWL